jgi:predicted nuclease of predicted toxin-antitoxin system
MPVTPQAVAHLEAKGHDAVHAFSIGLGAARDSDIERARAEDRIVVTADLDYPRLLAQLKLDRPGVILFRGGSYSDAEMLACRSRDTDGSPPSILAIRDWLERTILASSV